MLHNIIRLKKSWFYFLLGGIINTFFTYIIYYVLQLAMNYQLAYAIAYVVGIIFSYWLNTVMVFKETLAWRKFFKYPLVYVVQYSLSALLMWLLVTYFNLKESIAPLAILVITIPITYCLSKLIIVTKTEIDYRKIE